MERLLVLAMDALPSPESGIFLVARYFSGETHCARDVQESRVMEPRARLARVVSLGAAALAVVALSSACGSAHGEGFHDDPPATPAASGADAAGGADGSTPLLGPAIEGGAPGCGTTISGTVYDPAGRNPLYGVAVYVPKSTPAALPSGAACNSCSELYTGEPVAAAITDAAGKFTMNGVPGSGKTPLVLQVGKWRKQLVVDVTACKDNPLPDRSLTLPKNHTEGDIPNIAITTGQADTLECLLRRVGIDAAEYVPGAGGAGRIHIFQGTGWTAGPGPNTQPAAPDPMTVLWDASAHMMPYDMVLMSCLGDEPGPALVGLSDTNRQALYDYAAAGGRVFASHFHYAWFNAGPFGGANLASWSAGANNIGTVNASIAATLPNGQPFPKGIALKAWLGNVGALQGGELTIQEARRNATVSAANPASQPWIVADTGPTQYLSFDTPIGAAPDKVCGRVVFSDLHVGGASGDYGGNPKGATTPAGCAANDLSPQEKALEFMLFDLSSCVTPNSVPPPPPPVVK